MVRNIIKGSKSSKKIIDEIPLDLIPKINVHGGPGVPWDNFTYYEWVASQDGVISIPNKKLLKKHRHKLLKEAVKEYCISTGDLDCLTEDEELWEYLIKNGGKINVLSYDLIHEMDIPNTLKRAHEMGADVRQGIGKKVRASVIDGGKEGHVVFKYLKDKTKREPGKPQSYDEGIWVAWRLLPPQSEILYDSFHFRFGESASYDSVISNRTSLKKVLKAFDKMPLL